MKKCLMVGVVFLALIVLAGPVLAKEGGDGNRQQRRGRRQVRRGGMGRGADLVNKLDDLTEDQKTKITELRKGIREKMQAAKTRDERRKVFTTVQEDINKLLTEEQVKKLEELVKAARLARDPLMKLEDLTDEQKAKIAELRKGLKAKMEAAKTRDERRKVFTSLQEEIKKILTEEQAKKLGELRKAMRRGRRPRPAARKPVDKPDVEKPVFD
jgi:Spy/CpxP family protein refolding chaperone